MIYQITMGTEAPRKNVCIFAHPAWDHVVNEAGEPTLDFRVIFVDENGDTRPRVFRRLPASSRSSMSPVSISKPNQVYKELCFDSSSTGEVSDWALITIDPIHDLRALG
jgi:hypothetical protein